YVKVKQGDRIYILSARTLGSIRGPYETVGTLKGRELVGLGYRGPFDEFEAQRGVEHRVIAWDEVGEEEGTGVVHIAPGCGAEDFDLSKTYGLDVLIPIDENGVYVKKYGQFTGHHVSEVAPTVFDALERKGLLYKLEDYM